MHLAMQKLGVELFPGYIPLIWRPEATKRMFSKIVVSGTYQRDVLPRMQTKSFLRKKQKK